ncbi:DUF4349 domain-containing protein [Anaerotignum faecicola]|nr:DUF4349 domain-containing protein [Anaerotignum faecicola]
MECEKALELISLYIDGELNKEEQEEIIKHMEQCESCKKEYDSLKEMVETLKEMEYMPLPEGYHERLMDKIENAKVERADFTGKDKNKRNIWKKYVSIAAGLFVVAVIGIGGNNILTNEISVSQGEASSETSGYEAGGTEPQTMAMDAASGGRSLGAAPAEAKLETYGAENDEAAEANDGAAYDSGNSLNADSVNIAERKNIKTSYISIEVENFDEAAENIENEAEAAGGYVQNFNSYIYYEDTDNDVSLKSGSMTVRVDKNNYNSVKDSIKSIGEVSSENEYVEDVTGQYIDTEAKLEAKLAEESRLVELLKNAGSVQDIVSIEERLADVRGYIESYRSMIDNWDKLVELSTINIDIKEEMPNKIGKISPDFAGRIKDSFIKSINFLVNGFQDIIVGLAALSMPLLAAAAVLFILIKAVIYFRKKRKNKV